MKKGKLSDVFWDIEKIETQTESVMTCKGEEAVTSVYLYITVTSKTADEIAIEYGFSDEQMEQIHELIDTQYRPLYTVEGNSSDGCRERQYAVGNVEILGYGVIC